MKKLHIILFLVTIFVSTNLFAGNTKILWVFLKREYLELSSDNQVHYDKKTDKRLSRIGWQQNYSDFLPSDEIRSAIEKQVVKIRHYSRSLCAFSVEIDIDNIPNLQNISYVNYTQNVGVSTRDRDDFPVFEIDQNLAKSSDYYGNSETQLNQLNVIPVHEMGITGKGVRVGMVDTGFMTDHEIFDYMKENNRLIDQWDFINNDNNTQDEEAIDTVNGSEQHSHGTAAFSCLAGYVPNVLIGTGYDVEMLLAKTEVKGSETRIEEDNYVAAVEWLESNGVDIISSSLGYRDFDNFEYPFSDFDGETGITTKVVNWVHDRGVLFVTAAGNDATRFPSDGGLIMPGDAFGALTVGAVNSNGGIASFSSHGPTADGRTKPEVCAMGYYTYVGITYTPTSYRFSNGTSFATPLIAGCCALILEKYPHWTPDMVIENIKNFSDRNDDPDPIYGWGIPDIFKLITETPDSGLNLPEVPTRDILVAPNPICVKDQGEKAKIYFKWTFFREIMEQIPRVYKFSLNIYDIAGKKVYSQKLTEKPIGEVECVNWNLRNNNGNKISSGIYFIEITGKKMHKIGKMTIVK